MNQFEKFCYNKYLAVTRSSQSKPFKLRKDFENFEQTKDYPFVRRLCSFFNRFPQIDKDLYFKAPFEIYPDEQYFDLKFYTSQKAIKTYSLYMKQIQDQLPDSEIQLEFIKNSLRFIANFCHKNNLKIEEYITHKPFATYSWMQHIKNHEISVYALFGFENLQETINNIPIDELQLLLGGVIDDIYRYKARFIKSTKAKHLVTEGLKRIGKYLA